MAGHARGKRQTESPQPPENQAQNGRARARRTRLVRWISAVLVVVVAGLIGWGLLISRPAASTTNAGGASLPDFYGRAGQAAPNFRLKDLTNRSVALSDFRGKRVLVNFWYVACAGCQQEMMALEQFYAEERSQDVVILGVNIVDDASTASQFLQQLGVTYPVVLDASQQTLDLYGVTSTPSSFLIDAQGIIRGSVSGPLNLDQIREYFGVLR
ncbi:MAG TPA: TlpA disulfide reductase family protein [Ktedonobacterales bacterium]|nr:TlpA disulfide reductase family protein [Ktedonobacterales bacterium]